MKGDLEVKIFKNLRVKLTLAFCFMLIFPAISVGILAYSSAKEAVQSEVVSAIEDNINHLNETINSTIRPKIEDIEYLSGSVTSSLFEGEESPILRSRLNEYVQYHPEVQSIYVGTNSGLFIQQPKVKMADDYDPRKRDWYIKAMENKGEIIISNPYISAGTDDMVITISKVTLDGSSVAAVNLRLSYLQELTNKVKIGESGFALMLDPNKMTIAHPTNEVGEEATESYVAKMYEHEKGKLTFEVNGISKELSYVTNEMTNWKIAANIESSEISDAATPILHSTLLVLGIAIVIGALMMFFIIKSIIKPIKNLKEKAITISSGDLTKEIEVESNDDIGQLGIAFNEMQSSLRRLVQSVDLNSDQVAASSEQLTASAEQTTQATEQVAEAMQEVASSAEKQTTNIDQNVHALEEISHGVMTIAESSRKVSDLSRETTVQAEEGGQAVNDTVNQMRSIHESVMESNEMIRTLYERSKEVGSILDVISGIAEQTNLLSLNAAIEAARAGEHGKGFAVVADEVRKLAEQSQASAKEIHQIIQDIQEDTKNSVNTMARVTNDVKTGVEITKGTKEKFNIILQSTKEITPQMDEVSITAQQISSAIQEVAAIATDLALMAKSNAATSEEVAASSEEQLASMEEISASAQSLSSMSEELKALISLFKY